MNRGEIKTIYRKNQPLKKRGSRYPGFKQETVILPEGYRLGRKTEALPCRIVFERDVPVVLRDGTTIYTDIFRPDIGEPVPAIVAWSPYGKNGSGGQRLSMFPGSLGIRNVSGLMKWEGPDPAYWCRFGYAVCNPDTRGAFMSEGNVNFWGTQDGEDGADFIEWVSERPWCTGKVALSGNSWLAVAQWFIAAEQPEALAAIAPWEGQSDIYRDDVARGGIPCTNFNENIVGYLYGNNGVEDLTAMLKKNPFENKYWEDKRPVFEKIRVPAYVTASYTNVVHVPGTFRAFEAIGSDHKWLRIHNQLEWTDYYDTSSMDDLKRFFDHYLKGKDNGWEKTPRIRASVLDPGGTDITSLAWQTFPPKKAVRTSFFLQTEDMSLSTKEDAKEDVASYQSDDGKSFLSFEYEFHEDCALIGYAILRLWMSAPESDDMDVFVKLEKTGTDDKVKRCDIVRPEQPLLRWFYKMIPVNAMHFSGPNARLRASLRHADKEKSTDREVYHTFDRVEKLQNSEYVELLLNLGPVGMLFHKGEKLRLVIAGYDLAGGAVPGIRPAKANNKGLNCVKTGGRFDSRLQVPVMEWKESELVNNK